MAHISIFAQVSAGGWIIIHEAWQLVDRCGPGTIGTVYTISLVSGTWTSAFDPDPSMERLVACGVFIVVKFLSWLHPNICKNTMISHKLKISRIHILILLMLLTTSLGCFCCCSHHPHHHAGARTPRHLACWRWISWNLRGIEGAIIGGGKCLEACSGWFFPMEFLQGLSG